MGALPYRCGPAPGRRTCIFQYLPRRVEMSLSLLGVLGRQGSPMRQRKFITLLGSSGVVYDERSLGLLALMPATRPYTARRCCGLSCSRQEMVIVRSEPES